MFCFELWVGNQHYKQTEIAQTPGKAKYQYYLYLQDGLLKTDFETFLKHVHCKKIGIAGIHHFFGNKEQFESVCKQRNIEFAYQGMKIEVDGKMGTIVGANYSCNLDVVFDRQWVPDNCHPWYMTKYFDQKGNVIKAYT